LPLSSLVLHHHLVSPELILDLFIACGQEEKSETNGVRELKGRHMSSGFLINNDD
jgi:hypothetical protein